MKKSIGFFSILIVFLVSLVYNVSAAFTSFPTDPTNINEDSTFSFTVVSDLSGTVSYTDNTTKFDIGLTTGAISWTPTNNDVGSYTINIVADNGTSQYSETFTLNVVNVAPVFTNLADKKAHEDLLFIFNVDTDDEGQGGVTYDVVTSPNVTGLSFNSGDGTITWTPSEDDIGEIDVTVTADDGNTNGVSTGTFLIDVLPDFMCREGEKGTGLDIKIEEPDKGDNFGPGDKIDLKVNVDNDAKDMDVIVEAFLYNLDRHDRVDDVESDVVDIDKGDDYDFDEDDGLTLLIPSDVEFDKGDNFRIYVKALEDGEEDVYCVSDSIEIDVEREDNAVIIEEARFIPSTVSPGDVTELIVKLLNIGDKDQDDVTVRVIRSDLKIDETSARFDIKEFADNDNDATQRFTLTIPSTTKPRDYSIEVTVRDEDGDVYNVGGATVFVTLTVEGEAVSEASLELTQTSFEQERGYSFNFPVRISNNGNSDAIYILEVLPVGGWADPVTEIVSVDAGSETTVYPALTVKSSAIDGSQTAKISLKQQDGTALATKTINVNIKSREVTGVTGGVTYKPASKWFDKDNLTTVFWIIGDVALVVIVLYFVKLIFIRPR